MEVKNKSSFEIDDTIEPSEMVVVEPTPQKVNFKKEFAASRELKTPVNILRNERIIVRHLTKESSMVTNPKHVLYGGMSENAVRTFVTPLLRSGAFVNVLTDEEKDFLEDAMGLESGALNSIRKTDNYWETAKVVLRKQDNYFDLSDPVQYIEYKIMLKNPDYIAPSLQALQDDPRATYQFVIISEGEETKKAKDNLSSTMLSYKEFGKIENDFDTLRVIVETIEGKPVANTASIESVQTKVNSLIQNDSKLFLKVVTDPMLSTKVLIKEAIEAGIIAARGSYLYLREDNSPLCEANEDPTLNVAARYLNSPKKQDLLFSIQAKLKK